MNLTKYINQDLQDNYEYSIVYHLDDIKRNFPVYKYKDLHNIEEHGVPIALFDDEDNDLAVAFSNEPSHCFAVGCTGSGKTTSLAMPKMHILSELKNKPSFFVIDIKGELLDSIGVKLQKLGYKIRVIDLNNPEFSCSWNPLSEIYDKYHRAYNLVKEVVEHSDDINDYSFLKVGFNKKKNLWFELDNVAYASLEELNKAIKKTHERLISEAIEEVRGFAFSLIQIINQRDPHWEETSRDLFVGIVLALLEKSVLNSKNRVTREQFNLKNIVDIACGFSEEDLTSFFRTCDKNKDAYKYASKIVFMEAKTTKSCYLTCLSTQLSQFKSYGIQKVTIDDTINMPNMGNELMAIFLKMDDLKLANYSLAQLFVSRLYNNLTAIADKNKEKCLKIPMHFILDEFSNFPAFKDFGHMISVSRSRNIWFTMIVQSYHQLEIKYGADLAKVIVQNSNMQMFFGTNDYSTKKTFSDECGLITKISELSYLNGNSEYITNFHTNEYKAVTVSELTNIKPCDCYITCLGVPAMKTYMKRSYMVKEFTITEKYNSYDNNKIYVNDSKYAFSLASCFVDRGAKVEFIDKYVPLSKVKKQETNHTRYVPINEMERCAKCLLVLGKKDWHNARFIRNDLYNVATKIIYLPFYLTKTFGSINVDSDNLLTTDNLPYAIDSITNQIIQDVIACYLETVELDELNDDNIIPVKMKLIKDLNKLIEFKNLIGNLLEEALEKTINCIEDATTEELIAIKKQQ